jgi:hypothetical protein
MFWVVTGIVLAVVMLAAWLYDRRHDVDHGKMPSAADRAGAEADFRNTQSWSQSGGGFP